jgi:hypothetical protein
MLVSYSELIEFMNDHKFYYECYGDFDLVVDEDNVEVTEPIILSGRDLTYKLERDFDSKKQVNPDLVGIFENEEDKIKVKLSEAIEQWRVYKVNKIVKVLIDPKCVKEAIEKIFSIDGVKVVIK